jgi:hypothetical protein
MRSFLGIPTLPLQAVPTGQPMQLAQKSSFPPTSVTVTINWNVYSALIGGNPANMGVTFNLLTGAVKPPLDLIHSVYIDNTNSNVPVYVRFPSTGMTISAAPATADWYPAITQDLQVQVFGEGFPAGGALPTTGIWFTNVIVSPYSDPEFNLNVELNLATPAISRGTTIYNTEYGTPALGDDSVNYFDDVTATGVFRSNIFGSPYGALTGINYIYLTHVYVWTYETGASTAVQWNLQNASGSEIIFPMQCQSMQAAPFSILNIQKANIKLDASQTWEYDCFGFGAGVTNCYISSSFVFTLNAN